MSSDTFTAVDLSRLPAPTVVEPLSFEAIFADMLGDLRTRDPAFTATVESDPVYKLLQVCAYRELLIRQRVNDAARAVMTAYATGPDLEQLGALLGVARLLITPANTVTGVAAVFESDTDLRRRIVLAPEGFSVAGPEGAYVYHALSANAGVLDASAISPDPGDVVVTVLSRSGTGHASTELLAAVAAHLGADDVRPMTDHVIVQSAEVIDFAVVAAIHTFAGPDSAVVLAEANTRLAAMLADNHRLGRDVIRSALFAALHVPGVQAVTLTSPAADVTVSRVQVANCTGVAVTYAGIAE